MLGEATSSDLHRPPPEEAPSLDTLPDIARKFRRMATVMGATGFHVFATGPRGERGRIVPYMDTEYPGISEVTRALAECLPKRFAEQVATTSMPMWWAGTKGTPPPALAGADWAESLQAETEMAGIALPVRTERGQAGAVVFSGRHIGADSHLVMETHARCYRLFAIVANLRPVEGRRPPAMSKRELECLKLTANGLTSDEISKRLGLSVHTTNQYLANTAHKLNAVSRVHAVAKALRAGLIE